VKPCEQEVDVGCVGYDLVRLLFILALLVLLPRGFGQQALLVVFDQINPKAGDELVVGLAERCQRVVSLGVKAALADLRVDITGWIVTHLIAEPIEPVIE
jgi:hypothetical protein